MTRGTTLSRRAMLGNMGALAAAAAAARATAAPAARPNILWIVSEDNNPYVGAYGDKLAHTPTIDGLAAKGLLYRHVYSNAPVCAPSRFGILTGVYPESCAPANQMRAVGKLPKAFRTYPELLRAAGYFCTNNSKTDYNCDVDPKAIWDEQGGESHWRGRRAGQPFMAVFNYETTHESRLFQPTAGRVKPEMVRIPAYLPDTPGIRRDYASYHNLMEKMDGQLAERLAELAADGLAEDTIVFHYSDNGGVLPRSKRYCYEEGLRCEMVVYVPPKWQHLMPARPGSEIATPVSFIDLAPTLLSLAGIAQPAQMVGKPFLGARRAKPQRYAFGMRNRMDERVDFSRTVTDGRWRYIRNYMPHRPWGQHQAFEWLAKGYQDWEAAHRAGTLNPVQDRFFQTKPYEELYDLAADPDEIRNLAGDAAAAPMLATLRKALDAHMLAINDNGFLPEGMAGEGYVESRDRRVYPLADVMALGAVAARGDAADLPRLVAGLSHATSVMRYWAATGLLILGAKAAAARPALAQAMQSDTSPHVRIVAAEALCRLGDAPDAVAALIALSGDQAPSWQVQLHALNALCFIGDAAQPALPVARQVAQGDQEYLRSLGRYLIATLTGSYTPASPIFDYEHMMEQVRKGKFG
ncbi:sulfatase-like hydrolase/transferase [Sphingobium nicotianae]|uniref:Sulfatase-like hydrolase/transferase n=1 Tax=Sphingobium nicotianae TaxID=2782607 RepID=A0A9X1DA67_9SPHN|nr:sulfatase-like hydrolase/transferase [Sphingobium nicotianae]MBT2186093.1 sulfatase-like hydrolase/transferase [Sphingobium nicotianae]